MNDRETLDVYDERAVEYGTNFGSKAPSEDLKSFMALLPIGAKVLDLGCGPGHSSKHLKAAGFEPDPTDGSAEMVRLAQEAGLPARQETFDAISGEDIYDGVWANFSLLHAPRKAMPSHLAAIAKALKLGGVFHIGMKLGEDAARDGIGRFYTYYSEDELVGLLSEHGFEVINSRKGEERGLAGTLDPFIILLCRG